MMRVIRFSGVRSAVPWPLLFLFATNRVVSAPQKNNEPFPRQTIMKSATTSYSTARGSHPAMCCATPTASKLVTGWVFAG